MVNVKNLTPVALVSVTMKKFILEKGLMSAVNMGNLVPVALPSIFIRVFTLDKALMSALNGEILYV